MRRKDPSPARPMAGESYHFLRQQNRNPTTHLRYAQLRQLCRAVGHARTAAASGSAADDDVDVDFDPPSTII